MSGLFPYRKRLSEFQTLFELGREIILFFAGEKSEMDRNYLYMGVRGDKPTFCIGEIWLEGHPEEGIEVGKNKI